MTEANRAAGQGGTEFCDQREVVDDRRERLLDPVEVTDDMLPGPGGDGPKGIRGLPAYWWDAKTGQIIDPSDGRPTCSEEKLAELEEMAKDKAAVEVAADVCSGTQ